MNDAICAVKNAPLGVRAAGSPSSFSASRSSTRTCCARRLAAGWRGRLYHGCDRCVISLRSFLRRRGTRRTGKSGHEAPLKDVAVEQDGDGCGIRLDGRPVKTPARAALVVPTSALAEAIADEWRSVGERDRPRAMPR